MRGDRIIRHLQPGDPADSAMGSLAARLQMRQGQHPAGETPGDDQHMHMIMRLVGMPERKPWQLPGRQAQLDQGCLDEALPVGRGKTVSVGCRGAPSRDGRARLPPASTGFRSVSGASDQGASPGSNAPGSKA